MLYNIKETGSDKWIYLNEDGRVCYTSSASDASIFDGEFDEVVEELGITWLRLKGCLKQFCVDR